ncbi:hypothetical protein SOVF_121070 [Spinacia oleracea]|nr:hypothetical protein SOVF_121070 [Spinacia oleracea]
MMIKNNEIVCMIAGVHPGEQVVDKPASVVDLVSKSKSGGDRAEQADPLDGIPANVRSQVLEEVARQVRLSGGMFYSNVVQTYQTSSGSSSYSPRHPKAIVFPIAQEDKQAALVEDEHIPNTPHFSTRERAAICRSIYKLFVRILFCKNRKKKKAVELKAQVSDVVHHGDYAFMSIEEVRIEMQTTIDLQAMEVAALKSSKAELLNKSLQQDKYMMVLLEENKKAAAEKVEFQAQLEDYPQVKELANHIFDARRNYFAACDDRWARPVF